MTLVINGIMLIHALDGLQNFYIEYFVNKGMLVQYNCILSVSMDLPIVTRFAKILHICT